GVPRGASEGGRVSDSREAPLTQPDEVRVSREEQAEAPAALHRPWRLVAAGCELVVAAVAVWFAIRFWGLGVRTLTLTFSGGIQLISTRFVGSWMAGGIALGMVAGILLVDAVREVLLGIAFSHRWHRRPPADQDSAAGTDGQLTHLNGS